MKPPSPLAGEGGRTPQPPLWSVRLALADGAPERLAAAEAVLAPLAVALSSFEVDGGPAWAVEALTERAPNGPALRAALAAAGFDPAGIALAPVPHRDWVAESRRALPPLAAGRFFIHGSHFDGQLPSRALVLEVDAGLAFGTGRHETTRGCLLALDRLARQGRRFARPLDLGCGSGILALAVARLWPQIGEVLACDNDPQAVAVARDNARINGLVARVRVLRSDGYRAAAVRRRAPFDLVVANILAGPLIQMAGDLARHLAPEGVAILSGLLRDQEAAALDAHARHGLRSAGRRRLGDWSVLLLERD